MEQAAVKQASAPDYRALLAHSRRKAADTIAGYAGIGRALFEHERGALTDRERALMTGLLRRLVGDAEAAIRQALVSQAENASPLRWFAPGGEIFERIAATGMLRDDALIEAVLHRVREFQLQRAVRKQPGGAWSGTVAGNGADMVAALAGNSGQFVRDRLNEYLVAQTARKDAYENPMLSPAELEAETARRLFWNVAAVLRLSTAEHLANGGPEIDTALEHAVRDALAALEDDTARASRAMLAADALADTGRLDAALVVEALRRGEVQLSVAMFSRLSGMRQTLLYRLMFETGGTGLAIACRAVGMTQADFGDLFLLTRTVKASAGPGGAEELSNVMSWYDRLPQNEAELVAEYWCRPAGYLRALWLHERAERDEARPN